MVCLLFFDWNVYNLVDFALHVKSKQWTTLLGIHNYIKMFEKLRVCVCVSVGDRYRNNAAPKPNLSILQFCYKTIHNIIISFTVIRTLKLREDFWVFFLWEFQSVFPKRVTRFDTKSKSIIWNASGQCNSALYRGGGKSSFTGETVGNFFFECVDKTLISTAFWVKAPISQKSWKNLNSWT